MIVVVLIGIIAALAAPQIGQGIANNKVSDARNQALVAFRAARTEAARQGRAMGIYVDPGTGQIVRVDRSTSNLCVDLPTGCDLTPPSYGGSDCGLQVLRLADSTYDVHNVEIKGAVLDDADMTSAKAFCITPRGRMYLMTSGVPQPSGKLEILIHRTNDSDDSIGVVRRVIVGTNGLARSLR